MEKITTAKLPDETELLKSSQRVGWPEASSTKDFGFDSIKIAN
jgi:hypothetical protein